MVINFVTDRLPFCCGFLEVGEFRDDIEELESARYYEGHIEDIDNVIPKCKEIAKGRPIIFNFVRLRKREMLWTDTRESYIEKVPLARYYECSALRQKVRKYPGVLHLHTWINSNSGNQIDSYVIKG